MYYYAISHWTPSDLHTIKIITDEQLGLGKYVSSSQGVLGLGLGLALFYQQSFTNFVDNQIWNKCCLGVPTVYI